MSQSCNDISTQNDKPYTYYRTKRLRSSVLYTHYADVFDYFTEENLIVGARHCKNVVNLSALMQESNYKEQWFYNEKDAYEYVTVMACFALKEFFYAISKMNNKFIKNPLHKKQIAVLHGFYLTSSNLEYIDKDKAMFRKTHIYEFFNL